MIDKSLETARKLANMTQQELSEKSGVKRSKIAMVETGNLGFSAPTLEAIKAMDNREKVAFEYLMNDPIFGLAIASYFFPEGDEGLYNMKGNKIANAKDQINLGSSEDFGGGTWQVNELIDYVSQRYIISTIADIKRRIQR